MFIFNTHNKTYLIDAQVLYKIFIVEVSLTFSYDNLLHLRQSHEDSEYLIDGTTISPNNVVKGLACYMYR